MILILDWSCMAFLFFTFCFWRLEKCWVKPCFLCKNVKVFVWYTMFCFKMPRKCFEIFDCATRLFRYLCHNTLKHLYFCMNLKGYTTIKNFKSETHVILVNFRNWWTQPKSNDLIQPHIFVLLIHFFTRVSIRTCHLSANKNVSHCYADILHYSNAILRIPGPSHKAYEADKMFCGSPLFF